MEFGEVVREPDVRLAEDMGEVILDKEWLKENKKADLYYMYRDLWKEGDKKIILSENLRYDITLIPPRKLGREYVKTKGHYHPEVVPGTSYPEIYEVLQGKAHYLLQKKSTRIEDVVLLEAKSGDKAIIPPNYGHITINPSDEPLKMANWVDRRFDSIYEDILELGGGSYFELVGGKFVRNPNYKVVPELRRADPAELPEFGIESEKDMYELIQTPENLDFLSNPQNYENIFEQIL